MHPKVNVLMTGAGAPGAPGIIQCLLQGDWVNLTVGDADDKAVGKLLHANFVKLLPANNPEFTNHLLQACKEHDIQFILPLVTKELFPLSSAKKEFKKEGIAILVSDEQALHVANDKLETYKFLQEKDIAVPKFYAASCIEEFENGAQALGYPEKDFCFKPAVSNGSRGFRIVSDKQDESYLLFNEKPYQTYITYQNAIKVLSEKSFPRLLLSEYLPGEEYSVDCLAAEGKAKVVVPRLRIKTVNGISTAGRFVKDIEIIDYCIKIIEAAGLHANIGLQVKRSVDGTPLLLEINPRVQGSIVAGLGAGINLPLLALQQELGIAIEPHSLEVRWGTDFLRYWTEVYS